MSSPASGVQPRGKGTQAVAASEMKDYFVYILASGRNGTLYVGVTNELGRRLGEHKEKLVPGFTRRYGVDILVWYEVHVDINAAIEREKQIKGWNRAWKVRLIEKTNPVWNDLAASLM
jgi:putative endonuclease